MSLIVVNKMLNSCCLYACDKNCRVIKLMDLSANTQIMAVWVHPTLNEEEKNSHNSHVYTDPINAAYLERALDHMRHPLSLLPYRFFHAYCLLVPPFYLRPPPTGSSRPMTVRFHSLQSTILKEHYAVFLNYIANIVLWVLKYYLLVYTPPPPSRAKEWAFSLV